MTLCGLLSRASLAVGLAAFAAARELSLRAQVKPPYAALAGIAAFLAVLCLARWGSRVLGAPPEEGGERGLRPPPAQRGIGPGSPTHDEQALNLKGSNRVGTRG